MSCLNKELSDIFQNNLKINSVLASSDETGDDNNGSGDEDQGGSDETGDDNNGSGDEEQLPAYTASTAAPNTLITGVEQQLPANSGLSERGDLTNREDSQPRPDVKLKELCLIQPLACARANLHCLIHLQSQPRPHVKLKELCLIQPLACARANLHCLIHLQSQPRPHVKLKELCLIQPLACARANLHLV